MSFTYRTVVRRGSGTPKRQRPPRRRRSYAGWLGALRQVRAADVFVAAAVAVLLWAIVHVGRGATASLDPASTTAFDTSPGRLPYDAARSVLRMFIALGLSYVFTFAYAYVAARSRRAEKLLIPALDILQSVPVLGFLSITVTGFVALFPGSYLGLECASIFAIFTAQAWNLTFSFYQSLTSQPRELVEAARMLGLSRWRRFWRLDVPSGAIGLIWNGMMSMGGAWFFLVASESISVLGRTETLPGVGSYAGAAIREGNLARVGLALLAMVVVVVGVNALFWRPLVAWSDRFRNELTDVEELPRSGMLDLLRRTQWPRLLGNARRRLAEPINRFGDRLFGMPRLPPPKSAQRRGDAAFAIVAGGAVAGGTWWLLAGVTSTNGWSVFARPLVDGLLTLVRVLVVLAGSTVIWVPVGVLIGINARATRIAQPLIQLLASFPANFLFPFAVWVFLRVGIGIGVGGIVLMALGGQWYVLFNAIAGAQSIPSDLAEAMDNLGVHGWQRWRRLYLPAVFPTYVTGGITASGGAWNASIVSEVVTYGTTTLTARGLGADIADASVSGDRARLLAGILVMAFYVVALNRLLWRPLAKLAERRYTLA